MDHFMGCLPPKKDIRDYKIKASAVSAVELPESYSWLCNYKHMPVKNQEQVSSCVAHAMSSILEYHIIGTKKLSTNFIYGGQYEVCGNEGQGMYLSDACKIVKKYGDATEEDCPGNTEVPECYDIASEALHNEEKMQRASLYKIESYANVDGIQAIKYAIYKYGPVLAAIEWFEDCEVVNRKLISNYKKGIGYHAIVLYGWNKDGFLFQNSWGEDWGVKGRATLPYDYKIAEAKSIIDAKDPEDIVKPIKINNKLVKILCKIINYILNLIFKK